MARRSKKKNTPVEPDADGTIFGIYPWQFVIVLCLALAMAAVFGIGFAVYTAPDSEEVAAVPTERPGPQEREDLRGVPVRKEINPHP